MGNYGIFEQKCIRRWKEAMAKLDQVNKLLHKHFDTDLNNVLKYAPIFSCKVRRVFSIEKHTLDRQSEVDR